MRPLRRQGYSSFSSSSPYEGTAEDEDGESKGHKEYLMIFLVPQNAMI